MRVKALLLLSLATGVIAQAARAEPNGSATLAAPIKIARSVVAGGAVWRCADSNCTLASKGAVEAQRACRELSKAVGPIERFELAGKVYLPDRVAKCNGRK
jgi:hypothetical protein